MSDRSSRTSPAPRRWLVLLTTIALLSTLLGVLPPPTPAAAAEAVVFDNTFKNRTVSGTGTVTKPTSPSGTNLACLTASGNSSTTPLLSCSGTSDAQGSGALRLTAAAGSQIGGVFGSTAFSTTSGLEVSFKSYQYGGGGADGIGFILAAANPSTSAPPTVLGPGGGQLGYSPDGGVSGVANGYLGVGLDVYGNYSNTVASGSGCSAPTNISSQVPGAVVVRGPGSGTVGYCPLTTTYTGSSSSQLTLRGSTRANSVVPVKVLVNPTATAFTSSDGSTVAAGSYKVIATPAGSSTAKTLSGTLPVASSSLYPSSTWVNSNGVPKQLAFGFAGSTGGINDVHEISDVQVRTFDPDPTLGVSTTAYAASTSAAGDPVTYVARTSVSGAPVTGPITVTHTTPTGVLPLAAYADGFTCGAPSGRTITCATTGSFVFAVGSSSPDITIVAIATTTITVSTIRSSSSTTASATGAISGTDSSMGTGTLPTTPVVTAASPALGSVAGGSTVTLTGTNIVAATAVEIGTTAQLAAGTPVTLLTCASGDTTSCFVVSGSTLLVYVPSRSSSATVSLTVVTKGVADAADYVYADVPATIATPTATAGITSAVLTWTAPANNGSAITGYTVTPYLNGTAQTSAYVAGSATSRTLTGLTAGGSYTFTVAAVNGIGTSTASAKSAAVVPYALPGAPVIGSVVAADLAVTLSWTAPSSNGSAITGYVVTPYIGSTAQATRTFAGTATSQSITGLTAGTAYTFRVAAQNAAGTGPVSASSAAATPNAQPTLTFAAPPDGYLGVAYSTQLAATGGTSPFVWSVTSGTLAPGLTLNPSSGLLSGTPTVSGSYTFTIAVVDASNQSATKAVTMNVTSVPDAPARPTATAGQNQATVSWVTPSSNGSTITGYVITPYLAGAAQTPVTVGATPTAQVIGGLDAGGSYTFTVAAVNARGTSTASAASTAVVPYAALGAPTITAAQAADSSAVLTWTAPTSTGGSPITGYVVTPYIGSVAQTPQTFVGTATTQTVTGLTPGTAYTFRVAAQNASGATSLYRVNAGGPTVTALDGGLDWAADNSASSPYYGTGTATTSDSPSVALDPTIPAGTPLALFDTQRYDLAGGTNMLWQFPVPTGTAVTVRLYFANRYSGTGQVGQRVFDVSLDGTTVLDHFDAVAGAGGDQRATMRELTITSDGSVDIGFTPEIENPMISAIDIAQTSQGGTGPASVASTSVTPNASPTLTFAAPPSGEVAVAYSSQLAVTDGTSPFVWSVASGSLPTGLDLDASTGLLSGTPTTAGSYVFTVQVVDASGRSATREITLVVAAPPVLTFAPPTGEVSVAYSYQPTVSGGTAPYAWRTSAGSLQAGLTLNASTGLISGTPTTSGTSSVTLTVTSARGGAASKTANVVITALPTLTFAAPAAGQVAVAYSTTFTASGGTKPLVWSISSGSVPPGLTLSSGTGVLSGTPTAVGSSSFTVKVTDANNVVASKAVTLVVGTGPLVIAKTADVSSTAAGRVVTFTIKVTNTGASAFTAVALTDPLGSPGSVLDDATYDGGATASSGTVSYTGGAVRWTGDVPVGGSATITYSVTVSSAGTGDELLTSTVVASTPGTNCVSGSVDARCSVVVPVARLVLRRTGLLPASAAPGTGLDLSVAFTNDGQVAYSGISVVIPRLDSADDLFATEADVASSGTLVRTDTTTRWTGDIAVGATVTVRILRTVRDPDPGNHVITAPLQSDAPGSSCPTVGATDPRCSFTITVPELSITKTASRTSVEPGLPVGFTIVVKNSGKTAYAAAAGTAAVLSDSLVGVLDDAGYNGDASATSGSVGLVGPGSTSLSWSGDLAVGASVTITYSVTATSPARGDKTMTNTVTSTSPGSSCEPDRNADTCTTTTSVLTPQLTLTSSVSGSTPPTTPPTAGPGEVVTYTTTATNTGQTAYTSTSVAADLTDVLDDAAYAGGATVSVTGGGAENGTLSFSGSTLTWTGALAMGARATITYRVTISDPVPPGGSHVLVSSVSSTAAGATCSASGACSTSVRVLMPALTITQTADRTTVVAGGRVTYTVTLMNTGETDQQAATFRDAVGGPEVRAFADYAGDATASVGLVSYADPTLTWTGLLLRGQAAVVTFSVQTRYPAPAKVDGARQMTNTVTSTTSGSTCVTGAEGGCRTTVSVLQPTLSITKTADTSQVVAGGTIAYTVAASNTGEADYTSAGLSDDLNALLTYGSYGGDASATLGEVTYADGVVGWTGPLARGDTVLITFSLRIDIETQAVTLVNRVDSSTVGSNCQTGSGDPGCAASTSVAARSITLSGLTPSFTLTGLPGSTVQQEGAVGMTVTTNSTGGYAVTVRSTTDVLTGSGSSTDTIPVGQLGVRGTAPRGYVPLSRTAPVTVHTSTGPTSAGGDAISNDYRVTVPDVTSGTYTTELEYIATAQ